jgi:uncharacterized protein
LNHHKLPVIFKKLPMKYLLHASLLGMITFAAAAQLPAQNIINLEKPGERDFIVDKADLITEEDEKQIKELCDSLLTDKATPIIVVTVNSMAEHGGGNLRIETFAMMLFNQWGIGHEKLDGKDWNTGILLVVSKNDRKARIELGAGWAHEKDQLCQKIMDDYIIPKFKQGDFSGGIVAGVDALDKMARDHELPAIPRPWWHYALIVGFIALAIFTIVSLINSGSSGWAWLLWGLVFAGVGYLLYQMLTSQSNSSSGGFGGGSFGGGFSGGGGASGGW